MPVFSFSKFRVALIVFVGIGALFACTSKDKPYRPTSPSPVSRNADPCSTPILMPQTYDEAKERSNRLSCHLSTFLVPEAESWKPLEGSEKIAERDRYTMAFVELPERKEGLLLPDQMKHLKKHLKGNNQQVVLTYVHGWRHDADIGNDNVRRFHSILSYTRSALNTRCVQTGHYCDSSLTGVYVGWRGRSFAEPTKLKASAWMSPGAAFTIWGRKSQSEHLANTILDEVFQGLSGSLEMERGNPKKDKLMILGHSLGGNMLATYMEGRMEQQLTNHPRGQVFKAPVGDMVVLLNAAAEARKFTSLQRALRKGAKIPDTELWENRPVIGDAAYDIPKEYRKAWNSQFPPEQNPVYISITATQPWGTTDKCKDAEGNTTRCRVDNATGFLFPLSRYAKLEFDKEMATAIGHLHPKFEVYKKVEGGNQYWVKSDPFGVSHDIIVNRPDGVTRYEHSGQPDKAWCGTHDGWLRAARFDPSGRNTGYLAQDWDSDGAYTGGPGRKTKVDRLTDIGGSGTGHLQIRNTMNYKGNRFYRSVVPATSPIWNMRAHQTAAFDHAGYMNFPLLCGLNILWLDNPTAAQFYRPGKPDNWAQVTVR